MQRNSITVLKNECRLHIHKFLSGSDPETASVSLNSHLVQVQMGVPATSHVQAVQSVCSLTGQHQARAWGRVPNVPTLAHASVALRILPRTNVGRIWLYRCTTRSFEDLSHHPSKTREVWYMGTNYSTEAHRLAECTILISASFCGYCHRACPFPRYTMRRGSDEEQLRS